ncbi:MAG: hypothetical protein QOJ40_1771 [Verrucomicrobiota bacterium]
MFFAVIIWIGISAGIGYWVGSLKGGREGDGALLGALLGPIGWIIVAILPTKVATGHLRFARRGGYSGAMLQPGPLRGLHDIEKGVKLRCPNCGEERFVTSAHEERKIICPTCAHEFEAESNLAP